MVSTYWGLYYFSGRIRDKDEWKIPRVFEADYSKGQMETEKIEKKRRWKRDSAREKVVIAWMEDGISSCSFISFFFFVLFLFVRHKHPSHSTIVFIVLLGLLISICWKNQQSFWKPDEKFNISWFLFINF